MSRLTGWLVLAAAALAGAGCPSSDNCASQDHTVCREGVLYWANSCGELESSIVVCQEGCRADGIACQEHGLPCDKPADCPAGQGCSAVHVCGICSLDSECRSGERCQATVCVAVCSGPCCDEQGNLRPAGYQCNEWEEVRCSGTGCGADPQRRTVTQSCSGVSSACDGQVKEGNWSSLATCTLNQLCWNDGTTGGCTGCEVACREGSCVGCSNEPCCQNGRLADNNVACQVTDEFRCVGPNPCGADVLKRTSTRYCDGINLDCRGRTEYTTWTTVQDCADDAVCVAQGGQAQCQTCQAGCQAGACQEPCQAGPCCSQGRLASADTVCATAEEYRCSGDVCGGTAEKRTVTQFCSGASSDCNGTVAQSDWSVLEDCGADAVCESDATGAHCRTCELGCAESGCTPCTTEPCCVNGSFRPADFQCGAWTEYRCSDSVCGADAQQRPVRRFCSGSSYFCNGAVVPDAWLTIQNCSADDICQTDGQNFAECFACQAGCSDGQCR